MSEGEDNTAVSPDTGGVEEIVITDQDLYDHAMSNEPAPSEPAEQPAQAESSPDETQQGRDEKGRFAPKAQAQPEQPKPVQAAPQPQQQPKAPQAPQAQPQPRAEDHRVPLRELLEVRDRAQKAEMEATQLRQAFEYLQRNGFQGVGPQGQQPQAQPANPQQLFEQPDQYLRSNVIDPLRDWGTREMMQIKDGLSRDYAVDKYGEPAVKAAYEALAKIHNPRMGVVTPQGEFAFRQIMAAGNPYKELVEWHKKDRAIQAIGNDPDAWLRQKQQEWLDDERAQKAMVERLRQKQQSAPVAQTPKVNLPPSLSSVPASSSRLDDGGSMDSESLFRHAMK